MNFVYIFSCELQIKFSEKMNKNLHLSFYLLVFLTFCQTVNAQLILSDNKSKMAFFPDSFLPDSLSNIQIDKALAISYNNYSYNKEVKSIKLEGNDYAFWVKFHVYNTSNNNDWVIEFDRWHYVDLYEVDTLGNILNLSRSGHLLPYNDRSDKLANRNIAEIRLNKGDKKFYFAYLKLTPNSTLPPPVNLELIIYEKDTLYQAETSILMILSLFVGIFIVMFVYNLFIFLSTRDYTYLSYLSIIFINIIGIGSNFGYSVVLLQDVKGYIENMGLIDLFLSFLFGFSIIKFTKSFLNTKRVFRFFITY